MPAMADTSFTLGNLTYTYVDGSSEVSVGNAKVISGALTIPASVVCNGKTYTVTSIKTMGFYQKTGITSVVLPATLKTIGGSAFTGCTGLTKVSIPSSVSEISAYAFSGCTALADIEIPASVTGISRLAFEKTAWFDNLPDGMIYIGNMAYTYKGTMLEGTKISIKEGTTSIGTYAFEKCTGLASVEIPSSVTTIGLGAFESCSSLTAIKIPSSVTSIGEAAFEGCSSLKDIEIPNTVTTLENYTFNGCKALESIEIPASVTSMGSAFMGCVALKSVKIPASVKTIGGYAFYSCTNLKEVEIPATVTSIGKGAFSECTSLTAIKIPSSVLEMGERVFESSTALESVELSASLTKIEGYLFDGCTSLKSIKIPSSVTAIGDCSFSDCTALADIELPSTITTIGNLAFDRTPWLDNLPNEMIYIGTVAFKYNSTMSAGTSIKIKEGTTSIAGGAFQTSTSWGLVGIEIPSTVTSIGARAFSYCENLASIDLPSSVTEIGEAAFFHCTSLASLKIPSSVTKIEGNLFDACTGLTNVEIPSSVTEIGEYAFAGCTALTAISIPASVTTVGKTAFYNCTSLNTVEIASSAATIEKNAFQNCPLQTVTAPSSGFANLPVTSLQKAVALGNWDKNCSLPAGCQLYVLGPVSASYGSADLHPFMKIASNSDYSSMAFTFLNPLGKEMHWSSRITSGENPSWLVFSYDLPLSSNGSLEVLPFSYLNSYHYEIVVEGVGKADGDIKRGDVVFVTNSFEATAEKVSIEASTSVASSYIKQQGFRVWGGTNYDSLYVTGSSLKLQLDLSDLLQGSYQIQPYCILNDGAVTYYGASNSFIGGTSGIEETPTSAMRFSLQGSMLAVLGCEGLPVAVYSIGGTQVGYVPKAKMQESFALPGLGLYIVKSGQDVRKIIVTKM